MKIVIDIDENLYSYISKEDAVYFPDDGGVVWQAVKKGIVLSEHYGRLLILDEEKVEQELTPLSFSSQRWIGEVELFNATIAILEAKEQDKASDGDYNLQNVPLSDIDEATERFKEKLIEGCFNDKESSDEEIQTMLQALADADKE